MTKNFFVLVVITNMTKQQTLMLRKNIRNIFVKFHFFKKNWRMRILSASIFLSLLAGKLKRSKQNLQQKN